MPNIWKGPVGEGPSHPEAVEGVCVDASTLPGMVIQREAAGAGLEINDTAATTLGQEFLVANKNYLQQKTVTEAWTQNENMVGFAPRSGERFDCIVAAGNDLSTRLGIPLTRNGAGLLRIAAPATEQVLCHSDALVNAVANTLVQCVKR